MMHATGGTILAGQLALEHGWAINLGGGFHHAWAEEGGGGCLFDDIVLSIRHLRLAHRRPRLRAMVIDLDVHQGNGVQRDVLLAGEGAITYLADVFAGFLSYPADATAAGAIRTGHLLTGRESDAQYERIVRGVLRASFAEFPRPDIVFYNAGTDILAGDPLGGMAISAAAVAKRDELVFRAARENGAPVAMVLSGGYTKPHSARAIANSILNLDRQFGLGLRGVVPLRPAVATKENDKGAKKRNKRDEL